MKAFKFLQRALPFVLSAFVAWMGFSSTVLSEENPPHWSYGGSTNPTQWGHLGDNFAACEIGRDQSPINIDDALVGAPAALEFNYSLVPLAVVNNGHSIQVNYPEGSRVIINGEAYELLQFHFHTPSEHTNSGEAYAMELHLVHRSNSSGELAVVGIMMEQGTAHPVIDTIWEHIPAIGETNAVDGIAINAADLLPRGITYFSYEGSLTTPPCSEGVHWNILTDPIQVSEAQIEKFASLYQVNARPIQPTNGRTIELHKDINQRIPKKVAIASGY